MGFGVRVAVFVAAGLATLSACGSSDEPPSEVDLFGEYARSSDVVNDKFPSAGVSGEDRLANFASMGGPGAIRGELLSAAPCTTDCHAGPEARATATTFGGTLYERSILVKHDDGGLELVSLYVAQKSAADAVLIDETGATYRDLAEFRADNDVLSSDDLVLVPEQITAIPGEGKIVTVYGRSGVSPLPWLLGGIGVVAVLGAGLVLRRRVRGS